ncbi:MAG TPA: hypothetical protein VK014_10890 [Cyclobacteriaceae bacterium]|nr:hypothetical protein [Cyclobacteriaceae bacterium]
MKKVSGIFQLLVALFFGVALVYFLMFDSVRNGFNIQELTAGTVVIWLLVGLILFLIAWATASMYQRNLVSRIKKLELEKNQLKADIYDLERSTKPLPSTVPKRTDVIDEEKDGSSLRPRENFK